MSNDKPFTGFRDDIAPDDYHNLPGLSSSMANLLLSRSPAHAYHAHPTMGGHPRPATKAMDMGTMFHAMLLGKGKQIAVINVDDWRTNAAKALRDEALNENKIPVKTAEYDEVMMAVESVRSGLRERHGIVLNGRSELSAFWQESTPYGTIECRGQMDHAWTDKGHIIDIKKCVDASKSSVERSAERYGYALQCAAYRRAMATIDPTLWGRVKFQFVFCELEAPYAFSVVEPDAMFAELGEQRWHLATNRWAKCLAEGKWPAYEDSHISAPNWALTKMIADMEEAA